MQDLSESDWAAFVASALEGAGLQISKPRTLHKGADGQILVECTVQRENLGLAQVCCAQVFCGSDPQSFAEQLSAHFALGGTCATTTLDEILFLDAVKFPVLVFREARHFTLLELMKTDLAFKHAIAIVWDLIQAAKAAFARGRALGPVSPARCRVSTDGQYLTRVHLFTSNSFEIVRCHPAQIRAKLAGQPLPLDTTYDLWSIGLLFFELFFGVDLQVELSRLLDGNLELEAVAALYDAYLALPNPFIGFGLFCFPHLAVNCKDSQLLRTANALMCLCMRPVTLFRAERSVDPKGRIALLMSKLAACPLFAEQALAPRLTRIGAGRCLDEARKLVEQTALRPGHNLEFDAIGGQLQRCGFANVAQAVRAVLARVHVPPAELLHVFMVLMHPESANRQRVLAATGLQALTSANPEIWKNKTALLVALAIFAHT